MDDGVDYDVIDPAIRNLCRTINQLDEFKTLSSCQGHYAPDDVEESTRSGPAGPYIIFTHPEPEPDDTVEAILQELEETVQDCDADATYHGGALVRQLYTGDEPERHGRSAYTVTHPHRQRNVPEAWVNRFESYGAAVELVLDDGGSRGLDQREPDTDRDIGDVTYCASVIDFQAFTDRRVEHTLETAPEDDLVTALEEERDHILDRLEDSFQRTWD